VVVAAVMTTAMMKTEAMMMATEVMMMANSDGESHVNPIYSSL
jgi:hypothetical protein